MSDVTVYPPTAVAHLSAKTDVRTPEDEIAFLRGELSRLEQRLRTYDIALETLGIAASCAVYQLLGDYGVHEVVFERELVRRMMDAKPYLHVTERFGDTVVELQERNPAPISVGD